MKKFLLLVPIFAAMIFLTGCGSDDTIKVGAIKYLNVTEDELNEALLKSGKFTDNRKYVLYENLNTMTAALLAGQIDELGTYRTVALYLTANHPEHQWEISAPVMSNVFCCAMRAEDFALKKEFDAAIKQMVKDGTLTKILKHYLDESVRGVEPSAVELPTIYGAPTLKIGVTGDLPLLDYIQPDGIPAGFNTAMLAEISRIIGKNFVLVQIESSARDIALTSKQVDVIFWAVEPEDDILPDNFDTPDGMILTEPYFTDGAVYVKIVK